MNLLSYFNKAYFINLDEDINKKIYFQEEIKKSAISKICNRYTAVIGKYLDIRLVPDNIITKKAKEDIILKKQKTYGVSLTYGSLACALSHYFIYEECSSSSKPFIIFEDDIILDPDFDSNLALVLQEITNQYFDILYLGYNEIPGFKKSDYLPNLSKPSGLITGLYGYVVSPSGAKKLLQSIFPLNKQIDSSISDNIDKFTIYCAKKKLVRVRTDFGSKTQNAASCKNEYSFEEILSNKKDGWEKLFV